MLARSAVKAVKQKGITALVQALLGGFAPAAASRPRSLRWRRATNASAAPTSSPISSRASSSTESTAERSGRSPVVLRASFSRSARLVTARPADGSAVTACESPSDSTTMV